MINTYVIYIFGDNQKYEYKIIDLKEGKAETKVPEDSLVYKLCGETLVKMSRFGDLPFGNFDLLLEKRIKETNVLSGLVLASFDEIEKKDS